MNAMRGVLLLAGVAAVAGVAAGCFTTPPRPDDDAAPAPDDADTVLPGPRVLQDTTRSRNDGPSLAYTISIAPEANYVLVTAQIGGTCSNPAPPIATIEARDEAMTTYPLTSIATITGTPCSADGSHAELFELRSPPEGSLEIVIALVGIAPSLHSAAIAFANVDPDNPARATATTSGDSARTSVSVDAMAGDLVVNTLGHGQTIDSPGPKQMELFRTNVDGTTTLNNSSASTAPGRNGAVEMTWEARAVGQWQSIAVALRTPGAP